MLSPYSELLLLGRYICCHWENSKAKLCFPMEESMVSEFQEGPNQDTCVPDRPSCTGGLASAVESHLLRTWNASFFAEDGFEGWDSLKRMLTARLWHPSTFSHFKINNFRKRGLKAYVWEMTSRVYCKLQKNCLRSPPSVRHLAFHSGDWWSMTITLRKFQVLSMCTFQKCSLFLLLGLQQLDQQGNLSFP